MGILRKLPVAAFGIALAASGTAAAGTAIALTSDPAEEPRGRRSAITQAAAPTTIIPAAEPAPLKRAVQPDALAVSAKPVSAERLRKIGKLRKVRDVTTVDGGAIQLYGTRINTLGVDPRRFRAWTPPATAAKTDLWSALSRDEFVVSGTVRGRMGLAPGTQYGITGKSTQWATLGGSAPIGLPGVDMLVSRDSGQRLGLIRNVAVLVNAPGANPAKLSKSVRKILGKSQVLNLHEKKNQLPVDSGTPSGRPGSYMELYRQAATTCPGLSWTVLAAIGQIESGHGRNNGPSSAGALGPMQFMPATWRAYGVDGDRDGKADIMNPYDAVPAAAKYLCASGGGSPARLSRAIWAYNHSNEYVNKVLGLARAYARSAR